MKMIEHLFKFIETNTVWDRTFPNYIQLLNVQLQQIRNIIFWYFAIVLVLVILFVCLLFCFVTEFYVLQSGVQLWNWVWVCNDIKLSCF